MLHGTRTYLLQDADGQILETTAYLAGLDTRAWPRAFVAEDSERAEYVAVDDLQLSKGFSR